MLPYGITLPDILSQPSEYYSWNSDLWQATIFQSIVQVWWVFCCCSPSSRLHVLCVQMAFYWPFSVNPGDCCELKSQKTAVSVGLSRAMVFILFKNLQAAVSTTTPLRLRSPKIHHRLLLSNTELQVIPSPPLQHGRETGPFSEGPLSTVVFWSLSYCDRGSCWSRLPERCSPACPAYHRGS